jgi:hypothetical protein
MPILIITALVALVAIRWANALERTLPGTPVIGRDVTVPRAACIPAAYRKRQRIPTINVRDHEHGDRL